MPKVSHLQVHAAYETLRDRIIHYKLAPHTVLSDYKLAKELDMSRAPVREALLMLARDGLVITGANGKKEVSPVTLQEITDILHVRSALETEAVRILAENGWFSSRDEKHLKALHEKMLAAAKKGTVSDCYRYDDEFHHAFVSCAQSARITDTLEQMRLQMQRARWLNAANPLRQKETCREHETILHALLQHDEKKSIDALRTHFMNSRNAFAHAFSDEGMRAMASMITGFYDTSG